MNSDPSPDTTEITLALLDEHFASLAAAAAPSRALPGNFPARAAAVAVRAAGLRSLQEITASAEFLAVPLRNYLTELCRRVRVSAASVLPDQGKSDSGLIAWVRLALDAGINKARVCLLARLQLALRPAASLQSPAMARSTTASPPCSSSPAVPPNISEEQLERKLRRLEAGYDRQRQAERDQLTEICR